ncbi:MULTISPECIES: hypothetical protein [unclassified Gordonia (in: high G+C Gram-positive bacteria)]|uniref:hypothetical protein n=1 Tax=unclassified Gordonia (in: high G+C Gram-positive bacteria) TaxID=2657482 RepID=UPI001F0DE97B|nr:hypothetical protein [Gordonia sp. ABSL49_1]MCH5641493.1 hypothetical protein [Gordonia sp. ABSL49_1]
MTTGPTDQRASGQHGTGSFPAAGYPGAQPQFGSSMGWAPQPTVAPEFWLDPGPALPRRTWQRRTRPWIIAASAIGATIFATIAILALLVGYLLSSAFDAKGGVAVDCTTKTATTPGGIISAGTPVRIYDDRGRSVGETQLGTIDRDGSTCTLPFEVRDVDSTGGDFVVQIGSVYTQTVSESALSAGVVLRPL